MIGPMKMHLASMDCYALVADPYVFCFWAQTCTTIAQLMIYRLPVHICCLAIVRHGHGDGFENFGAHLCCSGP